MDTLLRGALAGALATLPMSAVMLAGHRLVGRQPPEAIVRAALDEAPVDPPERAVAPLAVAAHLGFGAVVGALCSALPGQGARKGVGVALVVWAGSYQGWVPALGILPPASRDRPGRPAVMLAAHVVYGGVLGALESRLGGAPAARRVTGRRRDVRG